MLIRICEIMGVISSLYIAAYFTCMLYERVQKTRITNKVAKIFCLEYLNILSIIIRMFAQMHLMLNNSYPVWIDVIYWISNIYYLIVGIPMIVLTIRNSKEIDS